MSAARALACLLLGLVAVSGARGQESAGDAPATGAGDPYTSFLDSLRAGSEETMDRRGAQETWPAADSLAGLLVVHGPAYADSLPRFHHAPGVKFDLTPELTAYNRVDGFRLGGGAKLRAGGFSLDGAAGYGFSSEDWRHRERVAYDTGSHGTFSYQYGDLLEHYGAGPVPANSIHALIAGADDQDYLQRRGSTVEWSLERERGTVSAAYAVVDERSAPAETDWNLFSRDRGPRPNPPIDEGRARRLTFDASTTRIVRPLRGARFRLGADAEIAGYGLGGDFDYDRYRLLLDSRWPVLRRDNLDLRFEIGAARNGPPKQSRFYLGGPAVMRAYGVNELEGDRYVFTGLDYLVGTDLFAQMHLPQVQLQFIPFFELGAAWTDENGLGLWSSPESHDWRSDAGLGIQRLILFDAILRLDLAWRLDRGSDRFVYRFGFRTPLFGLED
jgi:hypothetical protein